MLKHFIISLYANPSLAALNVVRFLSGRLSHLTFPSNSMRRLSISPTSSLLCHLSISGPNIDTNKNVRKTDFVDETSHPHTQHRLMFVNFTKALDRHS